jgi:hypothetical protein
MTRLVKAKVSSAEATQAIKIRANRIRTNRDFNEAIRLLEEIIEMQNKLEDKTEKRQKSSLEDLVD